MRAKSNVHPGRVWPAGLQVPHPWFKLRHKKAFEVFTNIGNIHDSLKGKCVTTVMD